MYALRYDDSVPSTTRHQSAVNLFENGLASEMWLLRGCVLSVVNKILEMMYSYFRKEEKKTVLNRNRRSKNHHPHAQIMARSQKEKQRFPVR